MVVIPVKEFTRLIPMNRDISAVKIKYDFLRQRIVLLDKVVLEQLMSINKGLSIHNLFHSTQRGFGSQNVGATRGGL